MKVLITGASGIVGRHIIPVLEQEHVLRLGSRRPPRADPRWVPLDVTDPQQVSAAMRGMEAVVHLAIASGQEGNYEDDAFNQQRFDVNVRGTFNVLEAARREGIKRFVHTSSLMVVWGYPPPEQVAADAPPKPVGSYALTKHLAEVACEHYARDDGMSILCMRIPKPVDIDDPVWKQRKLRPQWIAIPDLAEAYRLALVAPDIGFEIVTIVAESSKRRWDLSKAERLLGYRPKHFLENEGFDVADETVPLIQD